MSRRGGVTTKTLLATALVAALASTSFTASSASGPYEGYYLNYGKAWGTLAGASSYYNEGGLTGLLLNKGTSDPATLGATIGTLTVNFGYNGLADPDQVINVPSTGTNNVSILIVGGNSQITTASSDTIAITVGAATGVTGNLPFTTLTGLTIQNGGSLTLGESSSTSIILTAAAPANTNKLVGLNLVGLDLSAGGAYTGVESASDNFEVTSVGANATALNIGSGTYTAAESQTKLTAKATATATENSKVDLTAIGATISGGKLVLQGEAGSTQAATAISATVMTAKGYTGTATSYGTQLNGDKSSLTIGNGEASSIVASVSGTDAVTAGQAFAYGVTATGGSALNPISITIGDASDTEGQEAISASIGGDSVGANIAANAYGVYASETTLTINGTENAAIAASIGDTGSPSANKAGVAQEAAGLWAQSSTITINGDKGTTFSATNQNTVAANDTVGTIGVYGINAQNSTLNLTGTVTFEAEGTQTAIPETQTNQYSIYGIYATETTTNINGGSYISAEAVAADVTSTGAAAFVGGALNINGGDANVKDSGGAAAEAKLAVTGNFSYTEGDINVNGGDAGGTDGYNGGNSSLEVTGGFAADTVTINIVGGAGAVTSTTAGTAGLTITSGASDKLSLVDSTVNITGGALQEKAAVAGGDASMVVNGSAGTLLVQNSTINVTAGQNVNETTKGSTASLTAAMAAEFTQGSTLTLDGSANKSNQGLATSAQATFNKGLTLGQEGQTDTSSIEVGANSTLTLAGAGSFAYDGTSITVENGGTLTDNGGLNVESGATLTLEQKAQMGGDGTTRIRGTLAINGTSAEPDDAGNGGVYAGGLGTVIVNGEVTSDSPLYLQLIKSDTLTFEDGTMNAQKVIVGSSEGDGATLNIGKTAGGGDANVTIAQLVVGDGTQTSGVNVTGGVLTLGDPTANPNSNIPTSSLTINTSATFTLANDGVLVTNSQNLWQQAASEAQTTATASTLTSNIGGQVLNLSGTGGFIELTDKVVDVTWLEAANQSAVKAQAKFIIEGQLQNNGKKVSSVLPEMPQNAQNYKGLTNALAVNDGALQGVTMLFGTTLAAQPQTFEPVDKTGKAISYANLVIGGPATAASKLWGQPTPTTQVWTIEATGIEVGFANVNIGEKGNILITGGDELTLGGDGVNTVIGSGVNVYVGQQGGTASGLNFGGYTPQTSKGGKLDGNVYATNGWVTVSYGEYSITGDLNLGQAKSGGVGQQVVDASNGGLFVGLGGTLNIGGSLAGNNVLDPSADNEFGIEVNDGTLNVAGDVTANLLQGANFELEDNALLTVGQNLTITAVGSTVADAKYVNLSAEESAIQVSGNLTTTDTNVALAGSSLEVGGDFEQKSTVTKTPSTVSFNATNVGEVASTVKVGGNFTTTAGTISIQQSVVEVAGDFSINGQLNGTATAPTTSVSLLDGAQVTAANINILNAFSAAPSAGNYYQDGNISTAGTMSLNNSNIRLDAGSLNAGDLQIAKGSQLTLGQTDLTAINTALTTADLPAIDTAVVEASIGSATVKGNLSIGGTAPAGQGQTEVAIGNLQFDTTAEGSGSLLANGDAALILGTTDITVFDPTVMENPITKAAPSETNTYLVAGQTVKLGPNNSFAIGTSLTGTQPAGVNIGAGAAVIINPELLAQANAIYGNPGERQANLFEFDTTQLEDGETASPIQISPDASFGVSKPLGNLTINLSQGFEADGLTLTNEQLVQPDNPLYEAVWDPEGQIEGSDPAEYSIPKVIIRIIPEQVSGEPGTAVNSLATNTILDAAYYGYGDNEGANRILELLSTATYANKDADYALIRNTVNQWALIGAAAHAHETGILATSMIVDSVWDHSSKLAASSHEEAKGDLWITLDWNHSRANDYKAGGLNNGYKMDLYGATFGADYDFANGLAAGLAVSVGGGESKAKGNNAGQKTDVTYWGINLYGVYASPIVNVIGNVGYIGIKNKTKTEFGKGRPDANIWTIGVKAEKDFAINEQFTVTPHVGVRYLSVDVDDFNLGGFHYGTDKANLVQFPIGVAFAANLKTANGAAVKPFLDLTFVPTAGDKNVNNTFGIQGGTMSDTIDTTIASGAMFQGKIGVNASYGAHNFGLNFAIGGGNKGRLDTGLQAKYRFVF